MDNYSKELVQDRVDFVIKSLEHTLKLCENVNYNDDAKCEQQPAYLIGWSTSTIRNAIMDLKSAQKLLGES